MPARLALFCVLFAMGLAAAQAQPGEATAERPGRDRAYTIVTGGALRDALIGNLVQVVPCYSSNQCTVVFGRDGRTYHRHGDRVPWARGSYAIHSDQVCAVVPPGGETCHFLFRSGSGALVMVQADDPALRPEAVRITDAAGIPLPEQARHLLATSGSGRRPATEQLRKYEVTRLPDSRNARIRRLGHAFRRLRPQSPSSRA